MILVFQGLQLFCVKNVTSISIQITYSYRTSRHKSGNGREVGN